MKILMLNYEFPPLGGGAGNATYYMLKEMAQFGDLEIDLVTSAVGGYRKEKFSSNITIHFLDIGKTKDLQYQSYWHLLRYSWKSYWYSKKLIQQKEFDVCHAFFGIPCGVIAWLLGIPYIVSLRGADVPFQVKRHRMLDVLLFGRLSCMVWRKAKYVIANGEGLKNDAQIILPTQKIDVIPNGVDTEQFRPGTRDSEFTILSTSRFIVRKGIRYLIEGFADFYKEHQIGKLLLVGDGVLHSDLKGLVIALQLEDRISFLGNKDHDELPSLYQRVHVFALPSFNEGMSNSLLEAMASGCAVVATNTGSSDEILANSMTIEKGSSKAVADALNELYVSPERLVALQQKARKMAESMSWLTVAESYRKVYFN